MNDIDNTIHEIESQPLIVAGLPQATEALEYALSYAALGWAVLPLKPRSKEPLTIHGVKDASTDSGQIASWWARCPDANVGIAMGALSGIVALDIDPRNGGEESLDALTNRYWELPETVTALTGGGGTHYLFKHRPNLASSKPAAGVDFKSTGGYIVAAPSIHPTGVPYAWEASSAPGMVAVAELPEWVAAPDAGPAISPAAKRLPPHVRADIEAALNVIPATIHYDGWIKIGQAIHSVAAGEEGHEIWRDWSQTAPEVYAKNGEQYSTLTKWKSFRGGGTTIATLFHIAKEHGYSQSVVAVAEVPASQADPCVNQAAAPLPDDLQRVPGRLQQVVDYFNQVAWIKQPGFAVQGALTVASTLLSRNYISTQRVPANLWIMNVGLSSCGKEGPKNVIKALLEASGHGGLISESYTGQEALHTELIRNPAHMICLDEAGDWLAAAKKDSGGSQVKLMSKLKEVYGAYNSTMRRGRYANNGGHKVEDTVVYKPAVTVYLTTTPDKLYSTLSQADIDGGFLPRFLTYETHITGNLKLPRLTGKESSTAPADLIEWMSTARAPVGNMPTQGGLVDCERIIINVTGEAMDRRDELNDVELKKKTLPRGEVYNRMVHNAERVANVIAGFDNLTEPVVTAEIMDWACRYVQHLTDALYYACVDRISEGRLDALINRVLAFVKKRPGGMATQRELLMGPLRNATNQERTTVASTLTGSGEIEITEIVTMSGQTTVRWTVLQCS